MKAHPSHNRKEWLRKVSVGRVTVSVYRRQAPSGYPCFMAANYASGKRRFDSYATEAAGRLARQLSDRNVVAAAMTNEQAADYAAAVQMLAPFNLALPATVST